MKSWGLCLAAVLLAALAAGCSSEPAPEHVAAASSRPSPAAPPPARASAAAPREIPAVLMVEHEVDVVAERDGEVMQLSADEGSKVEAGTALARLDSRQVETQVEQAQADLKISEYNVKYNEAELHANQSRLERARLMYKEGLGSKADLDTAEFQAKGSAYDLESWKANVEKRRAELKALELELQKTRIRAPFGGVISRRYVRQGDVVTKGTKCFRLSQMSPLLVEFQVPETDAHKPGAGQAVKGTLLSDPNHWFDARITRVSPVVDAASGSYDVTATLLAPSPELKPGMAVRIVWPTPSSPHP
ncbi:MAG TPA: efflux RND transporter periplasmic adaptor subunit [Candidatus Acidoferrales bacterium]|nr:efflux RND transporter periplasmic adaptor subunit [Candidatus Acidoferrales bacterium]